MRKLNLRFSITKLINAIRGAIHGGIARTGYEKDSQTEQILGISFEEFRIFIEDKFMPGMSWKNYGEWHLDHIKPISWAKTEEEVYKLNHYSNFQPLWAFDNLSKGNRYEG